MACFYFKVGFIFFALADSILHVLFSTVIFFPFVFENMEIYLPCYFKNARTLSLYAWVVQNKNMEPLQTWIVTFICLSTENVACHERWAWIWKGKSFVQTLTAPFNCMECCCLLWLCMNLWLFIVAQWKIKLKSMRWAFLASPSFREWNKKNLCCLSHLLYFLLL